MIRQILPGFLGLALAALPARADRVELDDGSLLNGKVLSAEDGALRVETTFAGTLSVPLEHVRAFATDEAVHLRLAGDQPVLVAVAADAAGLALRQGDTTVAARPAQIVALWRQGAESPTDRHVRELKERARRKWAYEASAAITGRTGPSEKVNATLGFKATLGSDRDRLVLNGVVERAEDQGLETANRELAEVDYSTFFTSDQGWYVRSSAERDDIKALDLRSTTATGFTRKLVRSAAVDLEFRSGASYVVESYATGKRFNSPGLDLSILNAWTVHSAKVTTTVTYVPTFRDWSNYHLHHESGLEIPLSASLWKLKLGLANDYQSVPAEGVDKFDTTYFTSLLLNWK